MSKKLDALALILSVLLIWGCSKKQEKQQELPPPKLSAETQPAAGIRAPEFAWSKDSGALVTFYCEPVDSMTRIAGLMKNKIEEVYQFISQMLLFSGLPPFEFYCYSSEADLKKYTGLDEAFFIDNKCYYGYGPSFGKAIADFVISKHPDGESKFAFIRDGAPTLLDFSGRNYHHSSNNFLQEGRLDPITTMSDDQKYEALDRSQRLIEAASLCGFIMFDFGNDKFMELYRSRENFEDACEKVLGFNIAELQKRWEAFLPEHTVEKEEALEKAQGGTQ